MAAVSSPGCHYHSHKVYFAATGEKTKMPQPKAWCRQVLSITSLEHLVLAAGALCPALSLGSLGILFPQPHSQHWQCPCSPTLAMLPIPSSFLCLGTSLLEAAIMCKKEGEGKTSTARNHIISLQSCQETDCRSSCI